MRSGCKYHGDCFSCPYADCILDELEAAQADAKDGIGCKHISPKRKKNQEYYAKNRERLLEYQREYREKRRAGKVKKERKTADWNAYHREYAKAHREKNRERGRAYYAAHKEERNAKNRAYYAAHKDEIAEKRRRRKESEMYTLPEGNRQAADNLQVSG